VELAIAIAGPIVSVLLAAVAFAIAWIAGDLDAVQPSDLLAGSLFVQLAVVNATLAAFNHARGARGRARDPAHRELARRAMSSLPVVEEAASSSAC
jgi:hypothetical protein